MDEILLNLVTGIPVAGVLAYYSHKFWQEMIALRAEVKRVNDEYIAFLKKLAEAKAALKPEGPTNG